MLMLVFTDMDNVISRSFMLFMSCVCHFLHQFIAALCSPERTGLTSWLMFLMFIVILLLSHLVSWDKCDT